MKCEKCGKEIMTFKVGHFNWDGNDSDIECDFFECESDAVVVDLSPNWTGYELDDEEAIDTIHCPYCGKFPFENTEIQTYEYVRVVMFKDAENVNS